MYRYLRQKLKSSAYIRRVLPPGAPDRQIVVLGVLLTTIASGLILSFPLRPAPTITNFSTRFMSPHFSIPADGRRL